MNWLWRLLRLDRRQPDGGTVADGMAAARAKTEAEIKLRRARRDWPRVEAAHDDLAEWLDQALGRGR